MRLVEELGYVEVVRRLDEYLREPKLPFFLWLRLVVGERLLKVHRHHLGAQMRDTGRARGVLVRFTSVCSLDP